MTVYQRDAAVAFPKLHRVTIGKVLGAFKRCFVVRAVNLCPANNVAVLAQRVDPIIGHERQPQRAEAASKCSTSVPTESTGLFGGERFVMTQCSIVVSYS